MTYFKRNKMIFLLFFVVHCAILFCLNYMYGNDFSDVPHGLSNQYVIATNENDSLELKNGFDFLNKNRAITVVAQTHDKSLIGLYDPTMKYYVGSTKISMNGIYRYFSYEDYNHKNNVAIVIDDIHGKVQGKTEGLNIAEIARLYNVDVIHRFDYDSDALSRVSDVKIIVNLFSLEPSQITKLFIDSEDKGEIQKISKELENRGYTITSGREKKSILKTMQNSFGGRYYVEIVVSSGISLFFLFIYVMWVYLLKYDKYWYISCVVGATFTKILKLVLFPIFCVSIVIGSMSSIFTFIFLEYFNNNDLMLSDFFQIQVFLILNVLVVHIVSFLRLLKKYKRIMR